MDGFWMFLGLLPFVAFLYAAVGHGGASGYLALMALFSFAPDSMKSTALLLNLFVAGISFYHFARAGHFKFKLFLIFSLSSIPMSFLGGMQEIDVHWYKIILGFLLVFAVLRILGLFGKDVNTLRDVNWTVGLLLGAVIGFFSGLIGIGGGIILTPAILLLRWGTMKEAAAVSALFIWVNSAAGLSGQFYNGMTLNNDSWLFVALAVLGGYFGAYYGSRNWNNQTVRYVLAGVLVLASLKLIFFK